MCRMAAAKSSFASAGAMSAFAFARAANRVFSAGSASSASSTSPMKLLLVLLLFVLEDIGGALVAGQKIGAVLGLEECLQRLDPGHQPHQIVFMAQRKHRVDQIVADAFFPQRDFQAVGEEGKNLVGNLQRQTEPVFQQDADDAQRGAAKRKGIARTGRLFADGKKPCQAVQLVGQRHGNGDLAVGTASDGPTGL